MLEFLNTATLVAFAAVATLALVVAYIGSRYKVASANEALVRSGRAARGGAPSAEGLKVVRGGGLIVLPLFHHLGRLKLTARQITVSLTDAPTSQGVKVALEGVATFKVGADETSIRNAAERFLDTDMREVDDIVKNVLEGSLRSIVGTLTVEELNMDRQKFQQAVQSAAIGDLATSGLVIDSFTIQAISGEALEYMELVGRQELARRERDARMAQATADQEARVREAEAQQIKLDAERDVALREADVKKQTESAHAWAEQSGPLAEAEASQAVIRKRTELAELEAERKAKELLATTIKPAEADAEAVVTRAQGDRDAAIASAQAQAEQLKLSGEAEAEVVHKKGEAEARALELRAEAYRHFNDAAVMATILGDLPGIVNAAAEPIGKIQNLTVLSTDGASEIVRTATGNLTQASTAIKGLTGIDVPALFSNAFADTGAADAVTVGANGHDDPGDSDPGGAPDEAQDPGTDEVAAAVSTNGSVAPEALVDDAAAAIAGTATAVADSADGVVAKVAVAADAVVAAADDISAEAPRGTRRRRQRRDRDDER